MGRILLDPNAQAYTDDQIVAKVNAATDPITRADAVEDSALKESTNFQKLTQTKEDKLDGIAENAEVNPADTDELAEGTSNKYDTGAPIPKLTDEEVVGAINNATGSITREDALSQADLKIVKSEPQSGERAVTSISVDSSDKLAADHSDTPEP